MTSLRVDLLGPVRARTAGGEVVLGPARQRAVFAALAARANEILSRQELIDAVWGAAAPASADGSVYTYMSGLRRALAAAGPVLEKVPGGYRLRLDGHAVDVAEFERLCDDAGHAASGERHRSAADACDAALRLWRGEPYGGVPGPFAERERDRLRERWVQVRELRAAQRLELGEHAEAVAELRTLLGEHPLRETARGQLMLALYRSERQAEALEVFHDGVRVLRDELGVRPGPELRSLHERILAADPALGSRGDNGSEPRTRPVGNPAAPLVGRDDELETLRSLLAGVRAGRGHSVWLEGPAGIGKSALLEAAFADAREHGCLLAWAAADELSQRFPLQVMLECLEIDARSPDPRRAALAATLAGAGVDDDVAWRDADPMPAAVDGLFSLVTELCTEAPLVLVLDDLQWADEASVLIWHRLSVAARHLPLLLVGAARPAPNRADLARLRERVGARGHTVRTLAPLGRASSIRLLSERLGARPGPGLLDVARRTEGNPLFLRELADGLRRAGAVSVADGVAEIDPHSYQAPTSLTAAMGRTLQGLSGPTRDVLRLASLLGPSFTVADLVAVTRFSASRLMPVLDEAIAAGVVSGTGSRLRVRYPLLRQALYADIPASTRSALYRQAAEALGRVVDDPSLPSNGTTPV